MSKPSRLRGLKYPGWRRCSPRLKVEAHVASWIEINMDLGGNVDFLGRSFSDFVD